MGIRGLESFKACKDCPNRTIEPVNCHTVCETYLNAVNNHRGTQSKIHQDKKNDGIYRVFKQDMIEKTLRSKRR